MQVKGIIFDLDGTLVDSIDDLGDAANTLFKRLGYPVREREEFISWIGNGAARFIQEGIGSVIDAEKLQEYVTEFKSIYMENIAVKTRLYDGVDIMLEELSRRKVPMSVLSNKPHAHTLRVASRYLDRWDFVSIDGQKEGIPRKPDPTSALAIGDGLGIDPGSILFIGDSAGDIRTALAAGMVPVWVTWGYGDPEPVLRNQSIVVREPEEIIGLLR